jgi:hypothetical protein
MFPSDQSIMAPTEEIEEYNHRQSTNITSRKKEVHKESDLDPKQPLIQREKELKKIEQDQIATALEKII